MRFLVRRVSGASGGAGGATRFGGTTNAATAGADLARGFGGDGAVAGSAPSGSRANDFRSGAIERVTPFHRTRSSSLSRRLLMSAGRAWIRTGVQTLISAWTRI